MGRSAVALVLSAVAAGCVGDLGGGSGPVRPPGAGGALWACRDTSGIALGSAPVRRLTNRELENTLNDLFGVPLPELPEQPPDAVREGTFENDAVALGPSDLRVARWEQTAMTLGEHVASSPEAWDRVVPCARGAVDGACGRELIRTFGARALRRPLTMAEEDRYAAFFDAQQAAVDAEAAVQLTVAALLQAPQLMYRLELPAEGAPAGHVELTSYEVASRLSYFLWESMPDDELFRAAHADELRSEEGIRRQAERMLNDERARATVRNLARQWLHLDRVLGEEKDPAAFPAWSYPVRAAALEESERLVASVVFHPDPSRRTLRELLTTAEATVSPELAALYGIDGSGAVTLPASERAGILTRVAFLAGQAHEANGSPPLRGVALMERLLCEPRGTPPANADVTPPQNEQGEPPRTNRELFAARTAPSACQTCHERIDGFGFGFEHYDATGAYRTTDAGFPVDATGIVTGTDNNGAYDGAVELQARLADSVTVHQCVAQQWFRYAYGRGAEAPERCHLERIQQRFVDSGGDLRDLLVALVTAPEFRLRPPTSPEEASP
ncbi:MAG: DUF1592 domain-containing protein [Sandaracinaceae bacterium]